MRRCAAWTNTPAQPREGVCFLGSIQSTFSLPRTTIQTVVATVAEGRGDAEAYALVPEIP